MTSSDESEGELRTLRTHSDRVAAMTMDRSHSSRESLPHRHHHHTPFTYSLPEAPIHATARTPRDHSRRSSYPRDRRLSAVERVEKTGTSTDKLIRLLLQEERESKSIKKVLLEAMERISIEKQRAQEAEKRTEEAVTRLRVVNDARLNAMREAERANKELQIYKVQYDNAQQEILRAQAIINQIEAQRHQAEADAETSRAQARRLRESHLATRAHEEGRQRGFEEGLARGRELAQQEDAADPGPPPRGDFADDDLVPTEPDTPTPLNSRTPPESIRPSSPVPPPGIVQQPQPQHSYHDALPIPPPRSPVQVGHVRVEHDLSGVQSAIHPTSVHNAPPSPRHSVYEIPPDNYIPTIERDDRIRLPPPHEMGQMPASPGAPLQNLPHPDRPSSIPQPPPSATSSRGQSAAGGRRRRPSESSAGSQTTLSNMDLLGSERSRPPQRQPHNSRLSAIIEANSSQNSPATQGRQSIGPDHAARPASRLGDEERSYSNPRVVEQWAADSTPPRARSAASRHSSEQPYPQAQAPVGRQGGGDNYHSRMNPMYGNIRPATPDSDTTSVDDGRWNQRSGGSGRPPTGSSTSSAVEITIQPPSHPASPGTSGVPHGRDSRASGRHSPAGTLSPLPEHNVPHHHHQAHPPPQPSARGPMPPSPGGGRMSLYGPPVSQGGAPPPNFVPIGFTAAADIPGQQPSYGSAASHSQPPYGGHSTPAQGFPPSGGRPSTPSQAPFAPAAGGQPWPTGPPAPGQPAWSAASNPRGGGNSPLASGGRLSPHPQPPPSQSNPGVYDAANPFTGPRLGAGASAPGVSAGAFPGPGVPVLPGVNAPGPTWSGVGADTAAGHRNPSSKRASKQSRHSSVSQAPAMGAGPHGPSAPNTGMHGWTGSGWDQAPSQIGNAPSFIPPAAPPRSPSAGSTALPIPLRSVSPATPIRLASPSPMRAGSPAPQSGIYGQGPPIPIPAPGSRRTGGGGGGNNITAMHAQVYSPSRGSTPLPHPHRGGGGSEGTHSSAGDGSGVRPGLRHSGSFSDTRYASYTPDPGYVDPAFYAISAPPSPSPSQGSVGSGRRRY